ncbi:MAG TPA: C4-type zinc ribbon domain-containing protein [Longimicrobiaceae bacterium]|nr:C4-type zinc ribbon domain-containing protein [Longimicrobiaceae bacterium]
MHPQLETLLELQDLKMQRRELEESSREVEQEVFHVSVEEAVERLDAKIEEMEASLDPAVRQRYQRLSRRPRAVVPVIKGTCYGCFVSVPTALASDKDRNEELQFCDGCGRFLYLID